MGRPRRETMNPLEIETHHCWSRCVRRAFLMGKDPLTGQDFSHRRKLLYELHEYLASIFAIDVGTVNLMNNHLHDHLRSRPDLVRKMTDEEVVWRYRKAWPRHHGGGHGWDYDPTDDELNQMLIRAGNEDGYLARLRRSLSDISFFMARLKEPLAKLANREEMPRKTGHYWDGRYGNRKIETPEEGVVSFLYCDLQQAKAGLVTRLEDSDCSAIQSQIRAHAKQAFIAVHEREPGRTDKDGEELEQLEALYANCWFSPITNKAPLITEVDERPPKTELVLPAGYLYQQSTKTTESDDKATPARARVRASKPSSASEPSNAECRPRRRRGRPRRQRSRAINNRLKHNLRRRASRCNLLGLQWEEYAPLVQRIAEQLIQDRQVSFPPPQEVSNAPEHPPGCEAPDATPSSFQRGLKSFATWLATKAKEPFQQLLNLRAALPRSHPTPAT